MFVTLIDTLKSWYLIYSEFTSGNQFLGAVVAGGLTGLFWYAISGLKKLWQFLADISFVKMVFTLDDHYVNRENYCDFLSWVSDKVIDQLSRNYSLVYKHANWSSVKGTEAVGIGYGTHWFIYSGVLFRLVRFKDESNQGSVNKETIHLFGLTLSSTVLKKMVSEIYVDKLKNPVMLYIQNSNSEDWNSRELPVRNLSSMCLPASVKNKLIGGMDAFNANQAWFEKAGVAYKYTILLSGEPGTGKSSLIRMLATHYKRNLYVINLTNVTDRTLSIIVQSVPPKSMICIEDIDTFAVMNNRLVEQAAENKLSGLTLSGVLNALDGVATLNDVVVVLTTNHVDRLDPALLRKGRVDLQLTIPAIGYSDAAQYIKDTLAIDLPASFADLQIKGCDLQAAVFTHRDDIGALHAELALHCVNAKYRLYSVPAIT